MEIEASKITIQMTMEELITIFISLGTTCYEDREKHNVDNNVFNTIYKILDSYFNSNKII